MANKINTMAPRGSYREKRLNGSARYIPSVSVERPIMWVDDEEKRAYVAGMHKAIGKSLTRGRSSQHRVVKPAEHKIVQVRHEVVADQVLNISTDSKKIKAVKKLAYLMQEALGESLREAPIVLRANVGKVSCRPEPTSTWLAPDEQLVMGVEFDGWKGVKAKYPPKIDEYESNPLYQFANEAVALKEAIEATSSLFDPDALIADPYFAVMQNRTGTLSRDASVLVPSMQKAAALPASIFIGDPVLMLRLGPLPEQHRQIPLRLDY